MQMLGVVSNETSEWEKLSSPWSRSLDKVSFKSIAPIGFELRFVEVDQESESVSSK